MSTYPTEAFDLTGGCSCGANRYTLSVPPLEERGVILSAEKSNGQGDLRLPQTAVCFCNDCRSKSGSLVLFALLAPFSWAHFSLQPQDGEGRLEFIGSEHLPPKPELVLGDTQALQGTYFQMFRSSEKAMRCFCSKCGTGFLYVYTKYIPPGSVSLPMTWVVRLIDLGGTSGGLDFYLGSLDKPSLERLGGLDRTVFTEWGIPWIKDLFAKNEATKWHPQSNMAVFE